MPQFLIDAIVTAEVIVSRLTNDQAVTDEMLLEAAERFEPPLLPDEHMAVLRKELDPKPGRRRKNAPAPSDVARVLNGVACEEGLRPFIERLALRLDGGERLTDEQRAAALYRTMWDRDYIAAMCRLYRDFRALLGKGSGPVEHPVLGPFAIETKENTPGKRALEFTQAALRQLGCDPPSVGTMYNKLSEHGCLKK